jgi:hypothetical protein
MADRDGPGSRGVDNEISYVEHAMQKMEDDRQYKYARQNPGAPRYGSRNQQKNRADNFAPPQALPYDIRHMRSGEVVASAGQNKEDSLNQNHESQRPLTSRQCRFDSLFPHFL